MIGNLVLQIDTLPIKPFNIKDIDGIKGWIVTLVFLVLILLIKELMNFFSGKKKDKEIALILQMMAEQRNFNAQIQSYFQTIASKYSRLSSDEQINSVSNLTFNSMQKHLQLFQRKVIETNHIDSQKDYVKSKILEEVQNSINHAQTVLDSFYTQKARLASHYIKNDWVERIFEVVYKNIFIIKDTQAMDDALERIFKVIRFEYYENLKEAQNGVHD